MTLVLGLLVLVVCLAMEGLLLAVELVLEASLWVVQALGWHRRQE